MYSLQPMSEPLYTEICLNMLHATTTKYQTAPALGFLPYQKFQRIFEIPQG